ncbi:MAG: CDGSH iron-sulfur domain-containing protein [Methylococcales bacterium]
MTEKYNAPIAVEIEEGKTYGWCSCGLSSEMPLCDGTHKTTDTEKRSLKFVAEETKTVYLCACGKTENAPYCDGSHSS